MQRARQYARTALCVCVRLVNIVGTLSSVYVPLMVCRKLHYLDDSSALKEGHRISAKDIEARHARSAAVHILIGCFILFVHASRAATPPCKRGCSRPHELYNFSSMPPDINVRTDLSLTHHGCSLILTLLQPVTHRCLADP